MACYWRKSTVWPGKLISSKKTPKNSVFWRQEIGITSLWEDLEAKLLTPGQLLGYPWKLWGITAQLASSTSTRRNHFQKAVKNTLIWLFYKNKQTWQIGRNWFQNLIWALNVSAKITQYWGYPIMQSLSWVGHNITLISESHFTCGTEQVIYES